MLVEVLTQERIEIEADRQLLQREWIKEGESLPLAEMKGRICRRDPPHEYVLLNDKGRRSRWPIVALPDFKRHT